MLPHAAPTGLLVYRLGLPGAGRPDEGPIRSELQVLKYTPFKDMHHDAKVLSKAIGMLRGADRELAEPPAIGFALVLIEAAGVIAARNQDGIPVGVESGFVVLDVGRAGIDRVGLAWPIKVLPLFGEKIY